MLSVRDPEILSLVPDYRINLFSPAEIKDEEPDKLQSNLKEVMLFIKYSKDKRKLQELTSQTPGFRWYCKVLQSYFSLKPYIFKAFITFANKKAMTPFFRI